MERNFQEKKELLGALNESGKGIKYVLESAFKILGHPIVMFDTSYNLLAYVEIETDDPIWNELMELGTFSHETVDFFNSENFIVSYAESEVVALMKSNKLKYDRINGKLFDKDNVQLGNITVVACCKPFEENDAELIEMLCGILSVELQNSDFYNRIDRVYQETVLNEFIDGNVKPGKNADAAMIELYDGLKNNLYLGVVDISYYEFTVTHLAYFRDMFKKMLPEFKYFIHRDNILIVMSTDETLSIDKDLKKLNDFFKKYNIYAGISSKFQDLDEIKKHYREAIIALNYGLKSRINRKIFSFDSFRTEHLLYSSNYDDINSVCSPIVFSLQEYDARHKTSLLFSLYIYLLYGMDISVAAAESKTDPKTLSRQLKILKEQFEIDFNDGNTIFNIFISLKILDPDMPQNKRVHTM